MLKWNVPSWLPSELGSLKCSLPFTAIIHREKLTVMNLRYYRFRMLSGPDLPIIEEITR